MFGWGVSDGVTNAVQVCTSGCHAGIAGSGAGQYSFPSGIAFKPDGNLYVSNFSGSVEQVTPNGTFIGQTRPRGQPRESASLPTATSTWRSTAARRGLTCSMQASARSAALAPTTAAQPTATSTSSDLAISPKHAEAHGVERLWRSSMTRPATPCRSTECRALCHRRTNSGGRLFNAATTDRPASLLRPVHCGPRATSPSVRSPRGSAGRRHPRASPQGPCSQAG